MANKKNFKATVTSGRLNKKQLGSLALLIILASHELSNLPKIKQPIKSNNMSQTKKSHKQDPKEIAFKQPWEMKHVCQNFKGPDKKHLTMDKLKEIMINLGKNGKPTRSRSKVYTVLIGIGYKLKA